MARSVALVSGSCCAAAGAWVVYDRQTMHGMRTYSLDEVNFQSIMFLDDELEEIETSFMQERAELMHANQQELSALMQKRLDKEEQVRAPADSLPRFLYDFYLHMYGVRNLAETNLVRMNIAYLFRYHFHEHFEVFNNATYLFPTGPDATYLFFNTFCQESQ